MELNKQCKRKEKNVSFGFIPLKSGYTHSILGLHMKDEQFCRMQVCNMKTQCH